MVENPMKCIRILLLDDDTGLEEQINNKLFNCFISVVDFKMFESKIRNKFELVSSYQVILFDASYKDEQKNTDSLTQLEDLLKTKPELRDRCKILLGNDIVRYVSDYDVEGKNLILRCRALPHVIYGGNFGTKVQNIITIIKQMAKKEGFIIQDRLSEGTPKEDIIVYRNELCDLIHTTVLQLAFLCKFALISGSSLNTSEKQTISHLFRRTNHDLLNFINHLHPETNSQDNSIPQSLFLEINRILNQPKDVFFDDLINQVKKVLEYLGKLRDFKAFDGKAKNEDERIILWEVSKIKFQSLTFISRFEQLLKMLESKYTLKR